MSSLSLQLKSRYYRPELHPYAIFEQEVRSRLRGEMVVVDAGCGRRAPVLASFRGEARCLIGIDILNFPRPIDGLELRSCDLTHIDVAGEQVDIVFSRSVLEHIGEPARVFQEIFRILKPGGKFILLTANAADYATLVAKIVPNGLHPAIVRITEGRSEEDVFPTAYKANSRRRIIRLARNAGFEVSAFRYLGQYPSYLLFNSGLFLAGTLYQKIIEKVTCLNFLQGWIFAVLEKPAEPKAASLARPLRP